MNSKQLSKRLTQVAKYVEIYGSPPIRLADIGSDHAHLPCYLAINKVIEFAIASDIVQGPFHSAQRQVNTSQLEDVIDVRLGNGLDVVKKSDSINTVTICGMGGILMTEILSQGLEKLCQNHLLILQANMAEFQLRTWLMNHRYQIVQEDIISENKHYYEIIVAIPNEDTIKYTYEELLFGPINILNKTPEFRDKWLEILYKENLIYESMLKSKRIDNNTKSDQKILLQIIESRLKSYEI